MNTSLSPMNSTPSLYSPVGLGETAYLRPSLPTQTQTFSHTYLSTTPGFSIYYILHTSYPLYMTSTCLIIAIYLLPHPLAHSSTYRSTLRRLHDGALCQRLTTLLHGKASFDLLLEGERAVVSCFWGGGVTVAHTYIQFNTLTLYHSGSRKE